MASDREDRMAVLRKKVTPFFNRFTVETAALKCKRIVFFGGGVEERAICGCFLSRLRDKLHNLHAADEEEADRLMQELHSLSE